MSSANIQQCCHHCHRRLCLSPSTRFTMVPLRQIQLLLLVLIASPVFLAQRPVIRDEFREEPANVQSNVGDIAVLSCKPPRADPEPRIRWKKNGDLLPLSSGDGTIDFGRRIAILDDGSLQIRDLRREDEGQYVCTAQNAAGSRDSRPAQLSVHEKPKIIKGPHDINIPENSDVVFQCSSSGYPEPSTIWKKERGQLPAQRSRILEDKSLRIKKVKASDEGTYTCRVENRFGWQEAEARLTIHAQPTITTQPRTKSVGVGRRVVFECEAVGSPTPTVMWKKENSPLRLFADSDNGRQTVLDDGTLVIERVQREDAGDYICEAQSIAGIAYVKAKLEVKEADPRPPPTINFGPQNQTLPISSMATLQCVTLGEPPPSVRWYRNGKLLTLGEQRFKQLDTGTLQISELKRADTGWYTCKALSDTGETSSSAALVVEPPTDPNVIFHRTPEPTTYPGAPSRPSVSDIRETSARLSWKPNPNNGASVVSSFTVEYFSPETGEGWTVASDSVVENAYTVKGLRPNTSYRFIVRARNGHGLSVPSNITAVIKTKAAVSTVNSPKLTLQGHPDEFGGPRPGAHSALQLPSVFLQPPDSLGPTSAQLRWELNRRPSTSSATLTVAEAGITGTGGIQQRGIIDGFSVNYRPLSESERVTMMRPVSIENPSSKQQSAAVDQQSGASASATGIEQTFVNFAMQIVRDRDARFHTLTGLEPHTLYVVFVQPLYQNFTGSASNMVYLHTSEDVPYAAPANVKVHLFDNDTLHMSWEQPPAHSRNGPITGFKVYLFSNETNFQREVWINSSISELFINHLDRELIYRLRISAFNKIGEGPLSEILVVGSSMTAGSVMIVTQPWFIAAIIVCVGGAIWLVVCAVVVWLSRCRQRQRQTNKCVVNGNHRDMVMQHDAKLLPKTHHSIDSDNIYSNVLPPVTDLGGGMFHDYGTNSNCIYGGNLPASRADLAEKMVVQMFGGSDNNPPKESTAFYSDAYIIRPQPNLTGNNCSSLMRPGDNARHSYSSWRSVGDATLLHYHQQQHQPQHPQQHTRNSFRPIKPSMAIENPRDGNLNMSLRRPPAQHPSMSSTYTNRYSSDNEDFQNESNGGYSVNECSWSTCDDVLYRPNNSNSIRGQHEPPVSRPNAVWPQVQQQGPTSLTLRPDDYTLKQLPQHRSSSGKDEHFNEHLSTPPIPPPRQTRPIDATASTSPNGHTTKEILVDEVDRQLNRILIVTNNDFDAELDNNISRSSANNNNTENTDDDEVNNISSFSTALLPPSPAPNDDDGCYVDDITTSCETSQAIAVFT